MEFDRLEQTFVSIDESSTNINTITNAVQKKWGADYIIVTGDGLQIDDSSGTQGTVYNFMHFLPIEHVPQWAC